MRLMTHQLIILNDLDRRLLEYHDLRKHGLIPQLEHPDWGCDDNQLGMIEPQAILQDFNEVNWNRGRSGIFALNALIIVPCL